MLLSYKKIVRFLKRISRHYSIKKKIEGHGNRIMIPFRCDISGLVVRIEGDANTIEVKDGCRLNNVGFNIWGNDNHIVVGSHVRFNRGGNLWIENNHCELAIGDMTTFEETHLAVTEDSSKIVIGDDCMFAYDIDVRTGDSHSIIDLETGKRTNPSGNVIIGNHVWIAAHTSILKGSRIPNGSIVGTRSVVTRYSVCPNDNVLLCGNPASVIRENVTWRRERI